MGDAKAELALRTRLAAFPLAPATSLVGAAILTFAPPLLALLCHSMNDTKLPNRLLFLAPEPCFGTNANVSLVIYLPLTIRSAQMSRHI